MSSTSSPLPWPVALAASLLMIVGPVGAQMHEADPLATEAFGEVLKAVRSEPCTLVEKLAISTREGELEETAPPREVRWTSVPGRGISGRFDGFHVVLAAERLRAVHESSDDLLVDLPDQGSPYYALFNQFRDLPWPGLALAIGADAPDQCSMQLNSRSAWLQPTSVEAVEATPDSPARRRILFTSDFEEMWLDVAPDTGLPMQAELVIHDGPFVKDGVELIYRYEFLTERKPVPDLEGEFDLGLEERSRVDAVAALIRPAEPPRRAGGGVRPGVAAPPFDLPGLEDGRIRSEDLKGRVVLLDFWATWCGPCRAAMPRLAELGRWAREHGIPVEVVAVNTSEQSKELQTRRTRLAEFLPKQGWNLDGLKIALDLDGGVASAYGVRGLPTTVVVDAAGRVVTVRTGFGPGSEEELRELLLDLFEGGDAGFDAFDDVS